MLTPVSAYNVDVMRDQSAQLVSAHMYALSVLSGRFEANRLDLVV